MSPRKSKAQVVEETSRELLELMEANDQKDAEAEKKAADLAPGVYPDLPFEDYLKIPAASNTALGWLLQSPAHLRAHLDGWAPDMVDPTSVGSALHAFLLEGEIVFRKRYTRAPDEADNKGHKPWKEWVAGVPSGVIPMKAVDFDSVLAMAAEVQKHRAARAALGGVTHRELTVVWIDQATGVKCKIRIDGLNPGLFAIVDLKSAADASGEAFARAVFDHGYYRQAALYREGTRVATENGWIEGIAPGQQWKYSVYIAHEKTPPFVAVPWQLKESDIIAGHDEIWGTPRWEGLLPRWARCHASNEWPGYTEKFETIAMDGWKWRRLEERLYGPAL